MSYLDDLTTGKTWIAQNMHKDNNYIPLDGDTTFDTDTNQVYTYINSQWMQSGGNMPFYDRDKLVKQLLAYILHLKDEMDDEYNYNMADKYIKVIKSGEMNEEIVILKKLFDLPEDLYEGLMNKFAPASNDSL